MCIRDRLVARLVRNEKARGSNPLSSTKHAVQRLVRIIPAAVSYTHLRAHETVLDLVSPLLLEKNKNPPNS